jgi:hypothetical protein
MTDAKRHVWHIMMYIVPEPKKWYHILMSRNTYLHTGIGLLLLFVLCGATQDDLLGIPQAHAQNLGAAGAMINTVYWTVGFLISILNFLMWFCFMLLDKVMNPDWIFDLRGGTTSSLMEMLREIWQLCRDLVNLAMALILIYEAIMMIISSSSEKVKTLLPKFVAALVLVNFSWFIPRVIFDASQIATYTIYQIPSLLGNDGCSIPPTQGQVGPQPCMIAINYRFFEQTTAPDAPPPGRNIVNGAGWDCTLKPLVCVQYAPYGSAAAANASGIHTKVINGLIVNHARLSSLAIISNKMPGGVQPAGANAFKNINEAMMSLVKAVVILLFHIALFFPVLAMVAAFFIRIPILWVTMAFMPLAAVGFIIGDKLGEMDPKKIFMEQFLKAVFLPAKVAVPFTIGFIMVNAGAQTAPPASFNQLLPIPLFRGIDSLWQILWMGIAMFIIWKFSFKALESGGEFTAGITKSIQDMGNASFQYAKALPLSVPFIPAGGGKRASISELGKSIDPRSALQDLKGGRGVKIGPGKLDEIIKYREAASGKGGASNPDAVQANLARKPEARVKIDTNLKISMDAAGINNLQHAIDEYRRVTGDNKTLNHDVAEGLIRDAEKRGGVLTPEQAQKIRDNYRARLANTAPGAAPGAGGPAPGPGGAPAPAPAPAPGPAPGPPAP